MPLVWLRNGKVSRPAGFERDFARRVAPTAKNSGATLLSTSAKPFSATTKRGKIGKFAYPGFEVGSAIVSETATTVSKSGKFGRNPVESDQAEVSNRSSSSEIIVLWAA